MKDKLPVYLENLDLPVDPYHEKNNDKSYGFISVMYILSLIITLGSIMTVIILGNR